MFEKLYKLYGPQFLQGKIYKLVCKTSGDIYIGSTCCTLKERLGEHINSYTTYINTLGKSMHYKKSYEILEDDNYEMQLLENFPSYGKYFLNRREGWYQKNTKCINKKIAGRNNQEYYLDNKEKIDKKNKLWAINNAEKVKIDNHNYYLNNKVHLLAYNKKKYEENKKQILDQQKQYYEKNRDKIAEKINISIICSLCLKSISKSNMVRHQKSSRCIKK